MTNQPSHVVRYLGRSATFLSAAVTAALLVVTPAPASAQDREQYGRQLQTEHDRIWAMARQCQAAANAVQQTPEDLARGIVHPPPACMNYMPQWIAKMAFDECQLYRLRTGDNRTSCFQISGVQVNDQ